MNIDTLWHILAPVKVSLGGKGVHGNLPWLHGLLEYGAKATIEAEQDYVTHTDIALRIMNV